MFGDESGGLTIVHFLQPINSLFAKEDVDSVQCLFWPDVVESAQSYTDPATGSLVSGRNAEFVKIVYTPNVHSDSVLGVRYKKSPITTLLAMCLIKFICCYTGTWLRIKRSSRYLVTPTLPC